MTSIVPGHLLKTNGSYATFVQQQIWNEC